MICTSSEPRPDLFCKLAGSDYRVGNVQRVCSSIPLWKPGIELDFCRCLGYNTPNAYGVVLRMNELFLTLFVVLLFLTGVTTK
jgi:hypothetical protein